MLNKTLWIFGDSFSTPYDSTKLMGKWRFDYCNWKGYIPKTFGEIHGFQNVNTILMETDGNVWDGHYSESGHQFIASKFKELLLDDMKRCSMNSLYKKLI